MKINVLEVLKDYEGKDCTEKTENTAWKPGDPVDQRMKDDPITVRKVFSTALNGMLPNEQLTGDDKTKIFQISTNLYATTEPDFTVDQLAFIKDRVGKVYNALYYGRVCEIIEGKDQTLNQKP